ncbi:hypothetical protein PF005_g20939 [Phytophthora fragariae]|uniref:Uncharacterized protein n=1 Tax=Phytophthora fragariae TaxID=53985 RepID=A0A6A3WJJ8_9STRA|nr:hypothetical protein PF003_g3912 [Phytophthora fragariae]KAE8927917.1 hypothetical protein PF009_g21921 [Phytophthora fragariae]KAE9186191.1 hypothetical protein PF005_g20939 [Phytophthora fragariae]
MISKRALRVAALEAEVAAKKAPRHPLNRRFMDNIINEEGALKADVYLPNAWVGMRKVPAV